MLDWSDAGCGRFGDFRRKNPPTSASRRGCFKARDGSPEIPPISVQVHLSNARKGSGTVSPTRFGRLPKRWETMRHIGDVDKRIAFILKSKHPVIVTCRLYERKYCHPRKEVAAPTQCNRRNKPEMVYMRFSRPQCIRSSPTTFLQARQIPAINASLFIVLLSRINVSPVAPNTTL